MQPGHRCLLGARVCALDLQVGSQWQWEGSRSAWGGGRSSLRLCTSPSRARQPRPSAQRGRYCCPEAAEAHRPQVTRLSDPGKHELDEVDSGGLRQ